MTLAQRALSLHQRLRGKISVVPKVAPTVKNFPLVYTPGVGEVVKKITKNKKLAYQYTIKSNSVAVVTDGSRVLGLGNCGPEAALPVMEGKVMLFKSFADIDAFPLCLNTQDPDEIIQTVKNIAPVFGGINLEDIETPKCFRIEQELQDIGIPVMHDDQHGTAIAILAGLINAAKVVGKDLEELRVVVNGAGAAGSAIVKLLLCVGQESRLCRKMKEVIVCDSKGIISRDRTDLSGYKMELAGLTNRERRQGSLKQALEGADVFIGLSAPGALTPSFISRMERDPIVFALANPIPEIMPPVARKAGAVVVATGRSDFPNQINNVLAFPGVFRGALDAQVPRITHLMKLNAALAIAKTVKMPTSQHILPSALDNKVTKAVARAVQKSA
jgi:malate dehydrogenase (oxaloacetate-decarboxylating)